MRRKVNVSLLALVTLVLVEKGYGAPDTTQQKMEAANNNQTSSLNKDVIEGSWKQLKGKIQQKWAKLTNDDILKMKGTATELEGILQKKYGYTKAEAEKSIQEFIEENKADLAE